MAEKCDWTTEHQSTWERVKSAFANDWEQTKADLGIDGNRDMNQDVDDTVKQMAGTEDAFENHEQAFRFGHAAQCHYGTKHPRWENDLESQLREDYDGDFESDRIYIMHAYQYPYPR